MSNVLKALARGGAAETDPSFKQTVLLLHGDGTNGAQNNTFLDSSTNNFTITRNGNTTQGTFSPFSLAAGEWSNYFDGSGDFLDVPDNAALEIGASSFCIEAWINPNALPASGSERYIAAKWISASRSFAFGYVNTSGTIQLRLVYSTTGNTSLNISQNAAIVANTWQHIAITRDGTTARFFLNGVQQGSTQTLNATFWDSTEVLTIGRFGTGGGSQFDGYLSNLRVVIGSAVYTSNFTPSNTPLTAITNTRLLTCQSNRFVDNSTNAFAITRNGDVRVTPFSPFAPTAAYSAGTNGGSGYFDGTGDYLSVANNAVFQVGSGDFSMEGWFYVNTDTIQQLFGTIYNVGGNYILLQINRNAGGSNVFGFIQGGINDTTGSITSSTAVFNRYDWNHAVLCRTGTTLSIFVNGSRVATMTSSTSTNPTNAFQIGENTAFTRPFNGYISNVRFIKGSHPYDATQTTITVPTTPLTAITNTSLLLNFTNAGIFDNTGKNVLETVGNAQIDTTTKKFGTGSMEFDGTGDYLVMPTTPDLQMVGGNFTWEAWVYIRSLPTSGNFETLWSQRTVSSHPTGYGGPCVVIDSSGNYLGFISNSAASGWQISGHDFGHNVSLNTWQHIALVRNGSSLNLYQDGVAGTSVTISQAVGTAGATAIGAGTASGDQVIDGFIDDFRITNGVARYTANFTAPTKAFPDL